jgi:hypothetical protein
LKVRPESTPSDSKSSNEGRRLGRPGCGTCSIDGAARNWRLLLPGPPPSRTVEGHSVTAFLSLSAAWAVRPHQSQRCVSRSSTSREAHGASRHSMEKP